MGVYDWCMIVVIEIAHGGKAEMATVLRRFKQRTQPSDHVLRQLDTPVTETRDKLAYVLAL